MPETLLLKNASLPQREGRSDVLIEDGVVRSVSPAGELPACGAAPTAPAEVRDLGGRFLIPGLWDNHVHFSQWVTQRQRLDLSGTGSATEVLEVVRQALTADHGVGSAQDGGPVPAGRPVVGYGFRDGLWPDEPSVEALDALAGDKPVVLISGDLHCGWLSTAGARLLGVEPDASGLVREDAWFPAMERLQNATELTVQDYREAAEAAARRGVVGVVEFENTDNIALWPQRVADGVDLLRVEVSVWPDKLESALARGVKSGDPLESRGLVTMGPLKVIVDGSLNTRTAWCWDPYPEVDPAHPHACGLEAVPISELESIMRTARDGGLEAAIHAIGDRANTAVLDTFESLGMGGVVEHAQLVREQDFPRFAELGLTAGVQPEHAMDDRDVADRFWEGRTGRAFALRSLQEAGVRLRLGSDAPVAPLDPWVSLAAAVTRSRDGRESWHPEQRISAVSALAASTRGRTEVAAGDVADLAVVDYDPLDPELLADGGKRLRAMPVAATLLAGRFTWDAL